MGPERPKYVIDEETLLQFRAFRCKWKDIVELLFVSRWTIWRRVRELGIAEKTGFTVIENVHLDGIVRTFMNNQGGLVSYSLVRGHLRSMVIKRSKISYSSQHITES